MRKMIVVVLLCLLVFTAAGGAFATGPRIMSLNFGRPDEPITNKNLRFERLKEFTDEIHKINALRIDRLNLRIQVIERQNKILDLYIEARENGNLEALIDAREFRQQIREINQEIGSLHRQVISERKAFREKVKNGEMEQAQEHLNNVISLMAEINSKIRNKIQLLDSITDVLS